MADRFRGWLRKPLASGSGVVVFIDFQIAVANHELWSGTGRGRAGRCSVMDGSNETCLSEPTRSRGLTERWDI